jgi:4-amino-4-deoxychorismate lyase
MYRLIESIRLENGKFHNLSYHEQRMNRSLRAVFGATVPFGVEKFLQKFPLPDDGLFKCRLLYDDQTQEVEFVPYVAKIVRTVRTIEDNTIVYEHKFEDRSWLEKLFAMRGDCDEIIIIRNGEVTDSANANLVFKKDGNWYTPQSFLLGGTMRQSLLDSGKIRSIPIRKEELHSFESFKLINAMIGFSGPDLVVENIVF